MSSLSSSHKPLTGFFCNPNTKLYKQLPSVKTCVWINSLQISEIPRKRSSGRTIWIYVSRRLRSLPGVESSSFEIKHETTSVEPVGTVRDMSRTSRHIPATHCYLRLCKGTVPQRQRSERLGCPAFLMTRTLLPKSQSLGSPGRGGSGSWIASSRLPFANRVPACYEFSCIQFPFSFTEVTVGTHQNVSDPLVVDFSVLLRDVVRNENVLQIP